MSNIMARSIVITSGKGGVGKTSLTVTLGRTLAEHGQRVVVVDADFGLNNLDVVLGKENRIVYDLVDIAENRCRISQALISDEDNDNFYLLPSCHSYDRSALDGQSLRAIVASLKSRFDYVLIDSPAGIERGFHRAVSSADEAIVVTTPHISALRDAEKVLNLIRAYSLSSYVVLNRVRGDMESSGDAVTAIDVETYLGAPVVGVIPDSDAINEISILSRSINKKSEGYTALKMLCHKLHTGRGELFDASKKYRGFLGNLKRHMRKLS